MIDLLLPTVSQGLLWSLLALGVYITFRVLDIADLTVEGSFPLGASVAVTLLVKDVNPVTAILAAALAGDWPGWSPDCSTPNCESLLSWQGSSP